jgi:hypothetical protein
VGLEHFTGLETEAAVILLRAVESALAQFDYSAGYGQARAEGANVIVEVRRGDQGRTVRVELAEGRLTAPDLRVRVTEAGLGPPAAGEREPGRSWSVA